MARVRVIESRGEVVVGDDGTLLRIDRNGPGHHRAPAGRERATEPLDRAGRLRRRDHRLPRRRAVQHLESRRREALRLHGARRRSASRSASSSRPAERDAAKDNVERILRGERVAPFETLLVTKDGRSVIVALTLSAIIDASGEIAGVAAIGRDITEAKRAQAALADAQRQSRRGAAGQVGVHGEHEPRAAHAAERRARRQRPAAPTRHSTTSSASTSRRCASPARA